eukprot:g40601.t1
MLGTVRRIGVNRGVVRTIRHRNKSFRKAPLTRPVARTFHKASPPASSNAATIPSSPDEVKVVLVGEQGQPLHLEPPHAVHVEAEAIPARSNGKWYERIRGCGKMDYPHDKCLHDLFTEQAKLTPDRTALIAADGTKMTFQEVDNLTDKLAVYLRRVGVSTKRPVVAIYMERRVEYALSYIAAHKAQGAYMPLETAYPAALLANVLADATPAVVLTNSKWAGNLPAGQLSLCLDQGWELADSAAGKTLQDKVSRHTVPKSDPAWDPNDRATPDSLAYVVYSSGTTGKPKGIVCPHRGAVHSYHWRHLNYPLKEGDVEACNVFFVWEMLRALLKGYPTLVVPDDVIFDPRRLCQFLAQHRPTRMLFTPSLLQAVLDAHSEQLDVPQALSSLHLVILCGEVVTTQLADRVRKMLPTAQIQNLYSISECHDVSAVDLSDNSLPATTHSSKFCPAGTIMPNVNVFVLDPLDFSRTCAAGEAGEVFVGGPTLAIGYLNMPEKTAERFVELPLPDSEGKIVSQRLYRTGDMGKIHAHSGQLEILGRCDSMVKVRGYTIVLDAVEASAQEHSAISVCAAITAGEEGTDKRLVVYYVLAAGHEAPVIEDMQAFLRHRLPHYAVPSVFVRLDALPLSALGKVQKKLLPPLDQIEDHRLMRRRGQLNSKPAVGRAAEDLKAAAVEDMREIWAELLQLPKALVLPEDNFQSLGGHSLIAARLMMMIEKKWGKTVPAARLLNDTDSASTVAGLAALVSDPDALVEQAAASLSSQDLEIMRSDAVLPEAISAGLAPDGLPVLPIESSAHIPPQRTVFLTGATGYLGGHLLRQLLPHFDRVVCLVRADSHRHATERCLSVLRAHQLQLPAEWESKLTGLAGDMSQPWLGLSNQDWRALAGEVTTLVHCGAQVHLVKPYRALRQANVMGTQEMLRLAFACQSVHGAEQVRFSHVSTLGVFPTLDAVAGHGAVGESAPTGPPEKLHDGYSQSKWASEELVRQACQRGLRSSVFRPGNMAAHSQGGVWNPDDFFYLFLSACLRVEAFPRMPSHAKWPIELTAVDFAASAITALTRRCEQDLCTYHIVNPQFVHYEQLVEHLAREGLGLTRPPLLQWTQWLEAVERLSLESNAAGALCGRLVAILGQNKSAGQFLASLGGGYTNECSITLQELRCVDPTLSCPAVDAQQVRRWLPQLLQTQDAAGMSTTRSSSSSPQPGAQRHELSLAGKCAVITGASSGIGAAIARRLVKEGVKVGLGARRKHELKELEKALGGAGLAVRTDVTDRAQVAELVRHTEKSFGPVDILINCAGFMAYTKMTNMKQDEWNTTVDVNCKGVLHGVGATLPSMLQHKRGHIINISSDAGRSVFNGLAVYSASKYFVEALSRGLRREVKEHGIRVTCIQPGDVNTSLAKSTTDLEAKQEFASYLTQPGVQIMQPDDVADAVVFALTRPKHVAVNEVLVEPTHYHSKCTIVALFPHSVHHGGTRFHIKCKNGCTCFHKGCTCFYV